jgi:Fe-S cluster assembly iron-binding protein IscA
MLKVTERAAQFLSQVLEQESAGPDRAVRLVQAGHGWRIQFDSEASDDYRVEYDGKTVLVVDATVAGALSDTTMDLDEAGERPHLRLSQAPEV